MPSTNTDDAALATTRRALRKSRFFNDRVLPVLAGALIAGLASGVMPDAVVQLLAWHLFP